MDWFLCAKLLAVWHSVESRPRVRTEMERSLEERPPLDRFRFHRPNTASSSFRSCSYTRIRYDCTIFIKTWKSFSPLLTTVSDARTPHCTTPFFKHTHTQLRFLYILKIKSNPLNQSDTSLPFLCLVPFKRGPTPSFPVWSWFFSSECVSYMMMFPPNLLLLPKTEKSWIKNHYLRWSISYSLLYTPINAVIGYKILKKQHLHTLGTRGTAFPDDSIDAGDGCF